MRFPIYVCSKGRPAAPLFKLLREHGIAYTAFIEPQDAGRYGGHPHVMEKNDQGLAYARQQALATARERGHEYYWMIDDDVSRFYTANLGKNIPCDPQAALSVAERVASRTGVGIVSLEYSQFSWNAKREQVSWNSYCDCCVLIKSDTLADYRMELPLKVDRDFTLQVIANGERTVRLRDISFQVPTNGSNKGGLHDRYADGIEAIASRRMEELWPGVCEAKVKPNGRPDVKINWRAFK